MVILYRKHNGVFHQISRHKVKLLRAKDLNGDGIPDARYSTRFLRTHRGTCRIVARFWKTPGFGPSTALRTVAC
jgi:hypothetical protein